jgi:hypothetical protein
VRREQTQNLLEEEEKEKKRKKSFAYIQTAGVLQSLLRPPTRRTQRQDSGGHGFPLNNKQNNKSKQYFLKDFNFSFQIEDQGVSSEYSIFRRNNLFVFFVLRRLFVVKNVCVIGYLRKCNSAQTHAVVSYT